MTNITWGGRVPHLKAAGFTLIELMLTVGMMTVVGSMAAFQIGESTQGLKTNGAMRVVMAQMNTARELAITQRRYMQVNFTGTGTIDVVRVDVPNGTTVIASVPFEGAVTYGAVADIPDTPDQFGIAGVSGVAFGTATSIRFSSDGTLIDQTGSPINGTVFLNRGGLKSSARAVTVLGATGRVRGYRFDGAHWVVG